MLAGHAAGVEMYRKRNMKLKNLKIIFWGLCIAFCACESNKLENTKATDTRLAETKKVLKIENYTYEENSETIEIISGIDNKKTIYIKTYDDNHNLLKNYCKTDGYFIEYEYNRNNQVVYSKDNGGDGHEYFYEYDSNGDMTYFHSTIGGEPYLNYHAEYENHKLVHRYSQAVLGEHHEWWTYTDDFRKCTYKNSLKDGVTYYEYDSHGNKIYEKSYLGENFYAYDDNGNLISKKTIYEDGKNHTTIYEYDTMGNKISEKDGLFDTYYEYEFYDNGKIKTIVSYRKS